MASALLLSPLSAAANSDNHPLGSCAVSLQKSTFLANPKLLFASYPCSTEHRARAIRRCFRRTPEAKKNPLDRIPKQFREENLKDGLMENYKNVPEYLYGLTPTQLDMFSTDDNPFNRQSDRVTEESISAKNSYMNNIGMSLPTLKARSAAKYSMRSTTYYGGRVGRRSPPPDLPSLLLDGRIVFLGMPIVPAVSELIVAQFLWLNYDDQKTPIYLYVNSSGTLDDNMQNVGSETDAYAIADAMNMCRAPVYTVNISMAYGQAGMLFALGKKGYRALQPTAITKLYLPRVVRSSGSAADMWIKARELEASTEAYLELLERGIGKPKEELREYLQVPRPFNPQQAIEYGVADRIIEPDDVAYERRNYDEMLAQAKASKKPDLGSPQAATYGSR